MEGATFLRGRVPSCDDLQQEVLPTQAKGCRIKGDLLARPVEVVQGDERTRQTGNKVESRAFGGTNPSSSLVLRSPASHIEPIGDSNSTVPQARIFYRALLVAKVRID